MSLEETQKSVVVDSHCHTFNARDLPIYGFLKCVVLNADEKVLPDLVLPLAKLLSGLTQNVHSDEKELQKILDLLDDGGALEGLPFTEDEDELSDEEFLASFNEAIQKLEASQTKGDLELLDYIEKEAGVEQKDEGLESLIDVGRAVWSGGGVVARYIKWVRLLTKYRFRITDKLINTYSKDDCRVDLFTPALIDYDRWVNDEAKTNLVEQMKLMKANIRLHKGQVHPYFPFDPWRAAYYPDPDNGPLAWLQKATSSCGFVGAKLYPPMGYSAIDNASHKSFPKEAPDVPDEFGCKLDDELNKLYKLCTQEDIPILTHCADSNGVKEGYGQRASPEFWRTVIEKHPTLRVNLGHFGGLKSLDNDDGWAWIVGELLNNSTSNVYADISHYSSILKEEGRKETIQNLIRLFEKYPRAKEKIIFGTDWIMLARVKDHDEFLTEFKTAYKEAFGPEAAAKFMGKNAARFLGLYQGDRNRERLNLFYENNAIATPSWMTLVDSE